MVVVVAENRARHLRGAAAGVRTVHCVDFGHAFADKLREHPAAPVPAGKRGEEVVAGKADGHLLADHPEYVGLDEAPRERSSFTVIGDAPRPGL